MTSESKMTVETVPWNIANLFSKIDLISKPKFNRDIRWTVLPKKTNCPSFKNYILFLLKTRHSIFPISLGTEIRDNREYYIVIDGNNRINAIITFLQTPYLVFPEYFEKLLCLLSSMNSSDISDKDKTHYIDHIKSLSYKTISTFRRLSEIFPECKLPTPIFCQLENDLIDIQKKFLFSDGTAYDLNLIVSINLLKNGTFEEYSDRFKEINEYGNSLSQNELLAAILFSTHVLINDELFRHELLVKIKEYYDNRGKNELLEQYQYVIHSEDNQMNVFDFMIGFQNWCADKYPAVPRFDPSGLSLFFKLFKLMYGSIDKCVFTQINILDYIDTIKFACDVYNTAFTTLFPLNVNENIFNQSAIKTTNLVKINAMTIIFVSIITNRNIIEKEPLVKKVKQTIVYHTFSNKKFLKNITEEEYSIIKVDDYLEYSAGGSYIENICISIIKDKPTLIFDIPETSFRRLFDTCIRCNLNETLEKDIRVKNKRRKLNLLDKVLLCTFWNRNIPNKFLNEDYSLEHITPFSSAWSEKIDIDRIGNLFPTFEGINRERGNGDLSIYKNKTPEFFQAIHSLLPFDNYGKISQRKDRKTSIISIGMYNEYCAKNEALFVSNLVNELYSP